MLNFLIVQQKNPLPTRVFRFRDPFQKRIYDGLIQIGEESAAFFMDACQIMNQVKKIKNSYKQNQIKN